MFCFDGMMLCHPKQPWTIVISHKGFSHEGSKWCVLSVPAQQMKTVYYDCGASRQEVYDSLTNKSKCLNCASVFRKNLEWQLE